MNPVNGPEVVSLSEVSRVYSRGDVAIDALTGVSLEIARGEFVAITGRSGSGKSTLLQLMGGLDQPSSGSVQVGGVYLGGLDDRSLTAFRRDEIGFVFQFFNLLPTLTAWENVAVPGLLARGRLRSHRPRAVGLLGRVGLGDRVDHRPAELSGGQLQRVAIARALFQDPPLILADEPTGNLDSESGEQVLDLLAGLCESDDRTVVLVTHDPSAASRAGRVIRVVDGRVEVRSARGVRPA